MAEYDFNKIEKKWASIWLEDKVYEPDLEKAERPFYNLMMFPYPSAEGLHVGNMYAFVGADIYGRKKRMEGFDVFEPIGLDGFGIHSENYALKIRKHPKEQAKVSEKNFYKQLQMIGNGFSWDERLETYDPEYYKWTQWIFVQMFKRGLAVRRKAEVNWCPECLTVLADEQVLAGECERCATAVVKKELEQWFFKITDYAERLLDDLEKIDWSGRVKIAQRNWIGRSEGAIIKFHIPNSTFQIQVFTTRADTICGATYMVLSPEHELINNLESRTLNLEEVKQYVLEAKNKTDEERIAEGRDPSTSSGQGKTGVELKGVKAINPATKKEIPIWVADYVLSGYGTGAIMAVPAYDKRDKEFAEKFGLPVSDAPLVDKDEIIKKVGGKKEINYHLRDWLISRQRYWGPPIPVIYCRKCREALNSKSKTQNSNFQTAVIDGKEHVIHAVLEEDLPVLLPDVKDFRPTGTDKSPLATVESFVKTKCPKCGGEARRETDVSDTFLDSAWYHLRYPSVGTQNSPPKEDPPLAEKLSTEGGSASGGKTQNHNLKLKTEKTLEIPWNQEITKRWLPVDMYIGGAEHSVLHLLYTRFITKAFNDWGLIEFNEPFEKFRAHGLLIKNGAKMSKSRGNVVNPDDYIKKFGADTLRMYLMFLGPFEQGGDFRDESIAGIVRFLNRIYKFVSWFAIGAAAVMEGPVPIDQSDPNKIIHKTIKKITEDIENLQYNTAIAALMELLNEFNTNNYFVKHEHAKIFLKLLAPLAPFLAEELWNKLGEKESIHKSKWPEYDESKIKEETKTIVVQINGKMRDKFEVPAETDEEEIKTKALESSRIKEILGGKKPKKIIAARRRLVNIVLAK